MFRKLSLGKKSGFTIIEILVVVTVIGILIGIVIVVYPAYQKNARDTKRKSDLHVIADAYKAALTDGKDPELGISTSTPNFYVGILDELGTHPTLAGNEDYPDLPGGKLGELGYLKDTIMDPTWPPPEISSGSIVYSGYILIPCPNSSKGFYLAARLENPNNSNEGVFNQLRSEVDSIPSSDSNQDSCFYTKTGESNLRDDQLTVGNATLVKGLAEMLLNESNHYNYAIYAK